MVSFIPKDIQFLILNHSRYAVPDTPYAIGGNVLQEELNTLINTIINEDRTDTSEPVEFEFLIANEFLRWVAVSLLDESKKMKI